MSSLLRTISPPNGGRRGWDVQLICFIAVSVVAAVLMLAFAMKCREANRNEAILKRVRQELITTSILFEQCSREKRAPITFDSFVRDHVKDKELQGQLAVIHLAWDIGDQKAVTFMLGQYYSQRLAQIVECVRSQPR